MTILSGAKDDKARRSVLDAALHVFLTLPGHTSTERKTAARVTSKDRKRRASLDIVLFGLRVEPESYIFCFDTIASTTRTRRLTKWSIDPSDRYAQTSVY